MFTLKPGSCLISSANFFASPFSIAANMLSPETKRRRRRQGEKERELRRSSREKELEAGRQASFRIKHKHRVKRQGGEMGGGRSP